MIDAHTIYSENSNKTNQQKHMKTKSIMKITPIFLLVLAVGLLAGKVPAQNIAWGPATGITGDANLSTSGVYLDAFYTQHVIGFAPDRGWRDFLNVDSIVFNHIGGRRISYLNNSDVRQF